MFCTNCGKELKKGSLVCTDCGQTTEVADNLKLDNKELYQELIGNEYDNKLKVPLKTRSFILMEFLLCIPILRIVMLFIWSFGKNTNLNKKAFARSILIFWFILYVILIPIAIYAYTHYFNLVYMQNFIT